MPTQIYFNNKVRTLPGAYSAITSGEQNSPQNLDYGKVLIIDTGLGAGFGGGAGSNGTLAGGKDAVYKFTDVDSFKSFIKGSLFWKLSEALFFPYNSYAGVSTLYFAKAATTAPAEMVFATDTTGSVSIQCLDEGLIGNGIFTSGHLDKGYAFTIVAGVNDPAKFILKIWQGTWKGDHTDGVAYDELAKAKTVPILVIQSPEFNNLQTLIDWGRTDKAFGRRFKLNPNSAILLTGVVVSGDVTDYAAYSGATGGTETYDSLAKVLEAVSDLDYQFILSDETTASEYTAAPTSTIKAHILDPDTAFTKTLVIGGEADETGFDDGIAMAQALNSNQVIVVHGAVNLSSTVLSSGIRVFPPIYHAAKVLGRICGLQPQVPVTNKQIAIDGLVHNLTTKEQVKALDAGMLVTIADQFRGGFKVQQGVNTLQDNAFLFNILGQSFSVQFERIKAQVNRELVINSETDLLNDDNGVNVNTLSPGILKTWVETYLANRVATPAVDNLLISFKNVTVTRVDDYYKVTYGIVVNNEITKIFYTGFLFRS